MDLDEADMESIDSQEINGEADKAFDKQRKRKKFIRKVECQVCGDVANDHIHYGANCCYSCRAFFRRSIAAGTKYTCLQNKTCCITKTTRRQCQACRLAKCLKIGMSSTWVMTDEDKREKKQASEVKKKLKQQAHQSNQRSVDLGDVPLSSYLQRRAKFKQELKEGIRRSSRTTSESGSLNGDLLDSQAERQLRTRSRNCSSGKIQFS